MKQELPPPASRDYFSVDAKGEITCVYRCTPEAKAMHEINGAVLLEGAPNHLTQYYVGGEIKDRPTQTTRLDGAVLRNVPTPALVCIDGVDYQCDDSTVELQFDHPGAYHIRIMSWPYLPKEFVYEVAS